MRNVCGSCELARCASCRRVKCWEVCRGYEESRCNVIERAPFVCGDCHRFSNCGFVRASYSAVEAQLSCEKRLVETREGIAFTPAQLELFVALVRTCLGQGWSIEAIWAVHGEGLPVSARTMYKYVGSGILGLANIDLPRKVRYKPRRAVSGARPVDRDGRSYSDFLDLPSATRQRAVQMDTVIGRRGDFKCILTLHFPKMEFQIMTLLDEHTCDAVVGGLWTGSRRSSGPPSSLGSSGRSSPTAASSSATSRPSREAMYPMPGAAGCSAATRSARDKREAARRTTSSFARSCPRDPASRSSSL